MESLPALEAVSLEIEEGEMIELLLANYKCRLMMDEESLIFVDHEENVVLLEPEINKIGRSKECIVRFTDTTQRVSRLHLLINNIGSGKIELTDVSSFGSHYVKKPIFKAIKKMDLVSED